MCAKEFADTTAGDCESSAWSSYEKVMEKIKNVAPVPLEPISPDGLQQMALPGTFSVPSPGEMRGLGLSISWVLEYWSTSGKLPDRDQLFSFAQSVDMGPVGSIIMPLCLAHVVSSCVLIASGELGTVSRTLENMMTAEAPRATWQSTSRKMQPASDSGTSTTATLTKKKTEQTRSAAGGAAGKRGVTTSSKKPSGNHKPAKALSRKVSKKKRKVLDRK